jgi:hypothetical protein
VSDVLYVLFRFVVCVSIVPEGCNCVLNAVCHKAYCTLKLINICLFPNNSHVTNSLKLKLNVYAYREYFHGVLTTRLSEIKEYY